MAQLDPRFHGLINDLMRLASGMENPGVIIWVADVGKDSADFQSRTYLGNVRSGHAFMAIQAIVGQILQAEGEAMPPLIRSIADDINAAVNRIGSSDHAGSGTIAPVKVN